MGSNLPVAGPNPSPNPAHKLHFPTMPRRWQMVKKGPNLPVARPVSFPCIHEWRTGSDRCRDVRRRRSPSVPARARETRHGPPPMPPHIPPFIPTVSPSLMSRNTPPPPGGRGSCILSRFITSPSRSSTRVGSSTLGSVHSVSNCVYLCT